MFSAKRPSSFAFANNSTSNTSTTQSTSTQQLNSPAANGAFGTSLFSTQTASIPPPFPVKPANGASAASTTLFGTKPASAQSSIFGISQPVDSAKANSTTGGGLFTIPTTANSNTLPALTKSSAFARVSKDSPNPTKLKSRFSLAANRGNPYSISKRSDNSRDLFLKSVVAQANPPPRFAASKSSFFHESSRSNIKKLVIAKTPVLPEDIRGIKVPLAIKPAESLAATPVKPSPQASPRIHTPLKRVYEINKTAQDQGYWIYPPLNELFSYGFEQLASVSDLAIGRTGHGKIQFVNPVDLSEIRNLADILGNLVVFDATTVCVYPDDTEKAPVGTALNVPAIVTLENVFIKHQVGDKTIVVKDPTSSRAVRHMAILRHNIENKGGEFITYDVSHGIFVFKVPHFSTWGFMDDDLVYDEQDFEQEPDTLQHMAINSDSSFPEDTFPNRNFDLPEIQPPPLPVARFEESTISDETETANQPIQPPILALSQFEEQPVSDDWLQQLDYAADMTSAFASVDASDPDHVDLDSAVFGGLEALTKNSTTAQYELAAEKLRLVPAFEPHTFAKFGSTGLLVRASSSPSGFKFVAPTSCAAPILGNLQRASLFTKRGNGFPKAAPTGAVNFKFLANLATGKEAQLWTLASILFDPLPTLGLPHLPDEFLDSAKAKLKMQHRAKLLSGWLKTVVADDVARLIEAAETPLQVAYAHLTGGQIARAAKAAADGKNMHLAVLISLLGTDDLTIRGVAQAQLNDWANSGALTAIPVEVIKINELLAGNTTVSGGVAPIYLCEDLSWQQAFGLRLWYGTTVNEDISKAVQEFEAATRSPRNRIASPYTDPEAFELLRLFEAINPQPQLVLGHTAAGPWIPWALHHVFSRSLNMFKQTTTGDQLALSFALQLESAGHVVKAAFVLAHLDSDDLAKRHIQELLGRQVDRLTGDVVPQLAGMGLGAGLVHEARALQFRYQGAHLEECAALIEARQWTEAHRVLVQFVAPAAVVANDVSALFGVLMQFRDPAANVPTWQTGGQVYLDYVRLVEKLSPELASLDDSSLPPASPRALTRRLITGLTQLNLSSSPSTSSGGGSFLVQVASTLMSSYVGKHLKSVGLRTAVGAKMLDVGMDGNERLGEVREMGVGYFGVV